MTPPRKPEFIPHAGNETPGRLRRNRWPPSIGTHGRVQSESLAAIVGIRTAVLATLNLLAFAFHTVCELAEKMWNRAVQAQGRRTRFFEALRSLTVFWVFPSWDHLVATLAFAKPPPIPP